MTSERADQRPRSADNRPPASQREFLKTFREWLEDDSGEQEETWDFLRAALSEDRKDLSDRPLFA